MTGIFTATTDDGLELPVFDVTHPAFYANDWQQKALTDEFVRGDNPIARLLFRLPKPVRAALTKATFRRSVLGPELVRADGSFLSWKATYIMKLGPENLGAWASPIDRRVTASVPALALRWRVHDMARLVAEALEGRPRRPLHFVNVAGGPAIDTLNALLLLHRRRPVDVPVRITVLDGDPHGPSFGARALEAWQRKGAPLEGVDVTFRHVPYDWRDTAPLARAVDADADTVVSSEGGLFEYGSDEDIVQNLAAVRGRLVAVVGSVTRADEPMHAMKHQSTAATILRGLGVFRPLAARAGFDVTRVIERPFSDQVTMTSHDPAS
jgi:hypothetical protein